jgi:pyruvate carboxylase
MKMETTVTAIEDGTVNKIVLDDGSMVESEDLILEMA